MLFGQFRYLSVHTSRWWSVLRWKVLFCSEWRSASIPTRINVLWEGEGWERFLSCHLSGFHSRLTFSSARDRDIYQIRWSAVSDLWHRWRWRCQSSKCKGTSGRKVPKTIVQVSLSTTCRCLLWRQVVVNIVLKCRLYSSIINPMSGLNKETGNYHDQVKDLIEKMASSLDDTALKLLFVSVQQNNIDLCVQYAINVYVMFSYCLWDLTMSFFSLTDNLERHDTVCPHHYNPNDLCKPKFDSGDVDMVYTVMVWAFICEWILNSLNWVFIMG